MSIEESAKEFLKKLALKFGVFDEDLELSYDVDVLENFLQNVQRMLTRNPRLDFLLNEIHELITDGVVNLDEDLADYIHIKKCEIKFLSRHRGTKYRIRNFALSSDCGSIIPVKGLNDIDSYPISDIEKTALRRSLRDLILFLGDSSVTQDEFTKLIQHILNGQKNSVIATYNNSDSDFVKLYSKTYFLYLLKGQKTIFSDELKHDYSPQQNLINNVSSSSDDFTQFFEIYDVMDEYHHSDDLLVKYLKMYQIIEYLITRTILVKIQSSNSNQNLFLREMTSLSKHDDFDKKNFEKVFNSDSIRLTNWFQGKLSSSSDIKTSVENLIYPNSNKTIDETNRAQVYNSLTTLIYKLRNTIVHNKESEIHLTIHNIQLQKPIIQIIKGLLSELEKIVFDKVVNFDQSIKYKSRYLELY